MDILHWAAAILCFCAAAILTFHIRNLERALDKNSGALNDLHFKFADTFAFIEGQIARLHYDTLQRQDLPRIHAGTPLEEAAKIPGALDILLKMKVLKKKEAQSLFGPLAAKARASNIAIEPVLIALNDLDAPK